MKRKNKERVKEVKEIVFDTAIVVKGINGILELIGGIILFFVSSRYITKIIATMFSHELSDDPRDFLINHLLNFAQNLTISTKNFIAGYIVLHGIINLFLFTTVLKKKYWAYPVAIIILCLMIIYQIVRLTHRYTNFLMILTIIDIIFVYLMFDQYKHRKNKINLKG